MCPEIAPQNKGGNEMAQRSFGSAKRNRQYEKIKRSAKRKGRSTGAAKRIAAATTNRTRRARGEVKGRSKARRATNRTKRGASQAQKAAARKNGKKGGRARARKS
jgi:hypothetical protein